MWLQFAWWVVWAEQDARLKTASDCWLSWRPTVSLLAIFLNRSSSFYACVEKRPQAGLCWYKTIRMFLICDWQKLIDRIHTCTTISEVLIRVKYIYLWTFEFTVVLSLSIRYQHVDVACSQNDRGEDLLIFWGVRLWNKAFFTLREINQ